MNPFLEIAYVLAYIKGWTVDFAQWLWSEGWPFSSLGNWVFDLAVWIQDVEWWLYETGVWYEQVIDQLAEFLDWEFWINLWQDWVDRLGDLWDWFTNLLDNIFGIIDLWWDGIYSTVQGWIDAAVEGFHELQAAWDYFWEVIFPDLISFGWIDDWWQDRLRDIDDLILGRLQEWFPFYNELAKIWADIKKLFDDPEQWLLDHITSMLARFI